MDGDPYKEYHEPEEPVVLHDNETGEPYCINAGGHKVYLEGGENG